MKRHYQWQNDSIIKEVTALSNKNMEYSVALYTPPGLPKGSLYPAIARLKDAGFTKIFPDVEEGQNVLKIRGVKDLNSLLNQLKTNRLVVGEPEQIHDEGVFERERVILKKKDAMRYAAAVNLSSQAMTILNSLAREDKALTLATPFAVAANLILTKYGTKGEMDYHDIVRQAGEHLEQQGCILPFDEVSERHDSMAGRVQQFIKKHPVEVAFSVGIPFGAGAVYSGLEHNNTGRVLAGLSTVIGSTIAVFVPEKRQSKEREQRSITEEIHDGLTAFPGAVADAVKHPEHVPKNVWNWVRESPLRANAFIVAPTAFYRFADAMQQQKEYSAAQIGENPNLISKLSQEIDELRKTEQAFGRSETRAISSLVAKRDRLLKDVRIASDWKGKMAPLLAFSSAVAIVATTAILTFASKNRPYEYITKENYDQLYSMAAQAILPLPPEERDRVIQHTVGFLANHQDVKDGGIKADEIEKQLRGRIAMMETSPWVSQSYSAHCQSRSV